MAANSWLESELADLDEAEKFIQQTMSDFIPSGSSIPGMLDVINLLIVLGLNFH